MKRTLVIFDIDGTLVYSERRDSRCFAETYRQLFGREFPSIDWSEYPHVTDTTILQTAFRGHFGRSAGPEEVRTFQNAYIDLLGARRRADPRHSLEVPGARAAILRFLEEERFLLGIATGGWQGPARLKLSHVGIPVERIPLRGADGLTTREDILGALIRDMERDHPPAHHVVYLGDAVWDVRTTANLGLGFVGVRWRGDEQVLRDAGAGAVLRNFLDFDHLLHQIERAEPPRPRASGPADPLHP